MCKYVIEISGGKIWYIKTTADKCGETEFVIFNNDTGAVENIKPIPTEKEEIEDKFELAKLAKDIKESKL